jgi:CRISPR-associated protein Cas6/Cse3/CasE subtype I-E
MFISKIILNAGIPVVRKHLGSLDLLYEAFDSLTLNEGFIYRIDEVPLQQNNFLQPIVLVSKSKPDTDVWDKPDGFIHTIETRDYNIPVRTGMNYKFYLKANPSTRFFFKRVNLDGAESQKKWFESESFKNGFELIDCEVEHDGYIVCESDRVNLLSSIFTGSLKITDEKKFSRALFEGIGYGGEYGLGLLSIESFGCRNRNIAEEMKESSGNN